MWVMGIDPGKSGAIALIDPETRDVMLLKLDNTDHDIAEFISDCKGMGCSVVYQEKISAAPHYSKNKDEKFRRGSMGNSKLSDNAGFLRGATTALKLRQEFVPAGVWQRSLGCLSKGDKNVTKAKAQQLFPDIKITHATADALLIAEYGCRQEAQKRAGAHSNQ